MLFDDGEVPSKRSAVLYERFPNDLRLLLLFQDIAQPTLNNTSLWGRLFIPKDILAKVQVCSEKE